MLYEVITEWRWLLSDSLMRMAKVWQMHLSTNVHRPLRTRSLLSGIDQRVQRQKGLRRSVTLESRRLRRFDGEIGELIQAQARCLLLLELLAQTRWENSASALSIQRHYAISLQAKQMGQQLLALAAFCAGESPFLPPKDVITSYSIHYTKLYDCCGKGLALIQIAEALKIEKTDRIFLTGIDLAGEFRPIPCGVNNLKLIESPISEFTSLV